ncbi:MAG: sigma 54-interacting transcriptional regulator, partial [Candidatus Rokubacteria bacterium]|nr:sigma 54-interacting transcriptional regulator [Candidatus Rokubacteria bacterium]
MSELLGESGKIEALRENLRGLLRRQGSAARLPAILIQGETGTGKGLLARMIHRDGPRSSGPFVDINCAAIPENLLEAELFGFERGAFTDARHAKPGLFQTAHRGMLFLDEVGLLPESLQAKLLKVLEERAVRRLGSTRSEPVDVWIVSATNADLAAQIKERRFREDLYHRLAVLTLALPALRERERDAVLLAEHFLARACADYGLPPKRLGPDAAASLLAYPWPGNVRELSNVIERVALLAEQDVVTADMLGLPGATAPMGASAPSGPAAGRGGPPRTLDEAMASQLEATLEQTGWNLSRTAALLGIARNTLRARIEKLGLHPSASVTPLRGRPPAAGRPVAIERPPAPESEPTAAVRPPAETGAAGLRWERRRITFLRAAVITPDADDIPADASRALELIVDKVASFEGRVEALGRTGVTASFGLEPIEDAPRRAANVALAIQRAASRGDEAPPLRIALHVAQLLVGQVGGTCRLDEEAMRQALGILDGTLAGADPGAILVSAAAAPFLDRRFDLVPASEGGPGGRRLYRLTGRDSTGLGLWGKLGRFVGRDTELSVLERRWVAAAGGRGQLVTLVGEPGVGKSRLLWEFTHAHRSDQWLLLQAGAPALPSTTPYLPVIELARSYFALEPRDGPAEIRAKVGARLAALDPALAPTVPVFLALLDAADDLPDWHALDPAQRRQRTLDAVKRVLLRESREQPLLLVFEDAHWIDGGTQAVLDSLIEGLPTARVMILLSYRPEYQHGWASRSFYTQLRVDPLPPENAEELLHSLLGEHPALAPLTARLIEWTEGNPFFLEECVRGMVETEALVGEPGAYRLARPVAAIEVPATVEEVLAARIDRLPAEDRALLQSAAVIGRDVPLPVLEAIVELPPEALRAGLGRLQAAELVYETSALEPGYTFKHALTHEVASGTLLPERRRLLHARILEEMERLYADRLAELVDRLAYHAFHGGVWAKAVSYLRGAGARAVARSGHREAASYHEQALAALARLPETRATLAEGIDLRFELRSALQPLGDLGTIISRLREAETLARKLDDPVRLGRILAYLTEYFRLTGDGTQALECGRRALGFAEALSDLPLQIGARTWLGLVHFGCGDFLEAIALFRETLESLEGDAAFERHGLPQLPAVHSRTCLAWALAERGQFRDGIPFGEEAIRIAESVEHPLSLVVAYAGLGALYLRKGDPERAIPLLERGLELCQTWSLPLWFPRLASLLGSALAEAGRLDEGLP